MGKAAKAKKVAVPKARDFDRYQLAVRFRNDVHKDDKKVASKVECRKWRGGE
jgi:hypothetical protein